METQTSGCVCVCVEGRPPNVSPTWYPASSLLISAFKNSFPNKTSRSRHSEQPPPLAVFSVPGAPSQPLSRLSSRRRSTYYLQATSDAHLRAIIESISNLARHARKAAEKTSRLRRVQGMVRDAYESAPFQAAVAVLIVAVSGYTLKSRTLKLLQTPHSDKVV